VTLARRRDRRRAAPLIKMAMLAFTVGLLAIVVDIILFATGSRDLPLWLNLLALLAPIGFGLGLAGVIQENRHAARSARMRPTE